MQIALSDFISIEVWFKIRFLETNSIWNVAHEVIDSSASTVYCSIFVGLSLARIAVRSSSAAKWTSLMMRSLIVLWVLIDKASLIIGWKSETCLGNWFGFAWAKDLDLSWCLYCPPVSPSCSLSLSISPSPPLSLWKNLVCSRTLCTRLICPRICRRFWSTILKLAQKEKEPAGKRRR